MDSEMLKRLTSYLLFVSLCVAGFAGRTVAAQAVPEYVVGAQDSLKIGVFGEPDLSGSFKVDGDGTIGYPFLGRVSVGGKSLKEIGELLTVRLESGFVRRAQVSVEIETLRQRYMFVIGEVRNAGKYPMGAQMSLIEALAAAGSITQNAGGDVLILHAPEAGDAAKPGAPAATPDERTERVSLADLQVGRMNLLLKEGDTIFVQKAEKFFITGQVKSPGAYSYERNLTVLQALALAGGITDKGSNRRMKVIRVVEGKQVEKKLELTDTLQPGDTIVVPQRLL
jgi:polysaccharide biosynthesis/export protein